MCTDKITKADSIFLTEFFSWSIKVGLLLILSKGYLRTHLTHYAEQKPFFPFWRFGHLFSGTLFPWKQVLTPEHTHIPNIYTWQCTEPMLKSPNYQITNDIRVSSLYHHVVTYTGWQHSSNANRESPPPPSCLICG